MIELIFSAILSNVLGHGVPKGNVQIINKQEVYNVTTTSTNPEDIKAAALAPAPVAVAVPAAPAPAPVVVAAPEIKKKPPLDYVVYKPTDDVEVHLETQLSHKCSLPKRFVYTIWLKKHTFYGCWEVVNNQTHVLYESGNTEIYDVKELQQ